jgi:NAD(P)-dependent dehydrogenase (short-subunit alcohol dehydrogenase family)
MTDQFPPQHQNEMPAEENRMNPRPEYEHPDWRPSGLLEGKTALITGGDSGIGRAVAYLFAREGADIVFGYLDEHEDARETRLAVERTGHRCLALPGDLSDSRDAESLVKAAADFGDGGIDILVDNAAVQYDDDAFADAHIEDMQRIVNTNLLGTLYVTHAALPLIRPGGAILVTTSVTAYRGSTHLVTYAATKGALASFVRSLGGQLADRGIRVNGVAPGPVWTPLIVGSFSEKEVEEFGSDAPMGRAAQPWEIAPAYVFLASERWSGYLTGQVVHPNGGEAVNA